MAFLASQLPLASLGSAVVSQLACRGLQLGSFTALNNLANVEGFNHRCYATEGEDDNRPVEWFRGRKRKLRPKGRYAVKLLEKSPHLFQQMRLILGYYDDPRLQEKAPDFKIDKVTVSNLQTLRYLQIDPSDRKYDQALRERLVKYKIYSMNRELHPMLEKTEALLERHNAEALEFKPQLPSLGLGLASSS